jgi:hypothetical protein
MTQDQVAQAEKVGLEKNGWYTHIHADKDEAGLINYHTHGLADKYNQALDLQIVRDINHVLANLVFWEFADLMASGEKLRTGEKYALKKFDMIVMLANALEGGRIVHRIILPDLDGWLMQDQQAAEYAAQWNGAIIV